MKGIFGILEATLGVVFWLRNGFFLFFLSGKSVCNWSLTSVLHVQVELINSLDCNPVWAFKLCSGQLKPLGDSSSHCRFRGQEDAEDGGWRVSRHVHQKLLLSFFFCDMEVQEEHYINRENTKAQV